MMVRQHFVTSCQTRRLQKFIITVEVSRSMGTCRAVRPTRGRGKPSTHSESESERYLLKVLSLNSIDPLYLDQCINLMLNIIFFLTVTTIYICCGSSIFCHSVIQIVHSVQVTKNNYKEPRRNPANSTLVVWSCDQYYT